MLPSQVSAAKDAVRNLGHPAYFTRICRFIHARNRCSISCMPQGLYRLHQSGQSHFVTFSCFHRSPRLTSPDACRVFLEALEAARKRCAMRIYGYVLMPEHVHLLVSEPEAVPLATAMRFLKVSSAKRTRSEEGGALWQARYHDRNVRDYDEFTVKLRYLHRNPVKRGLCTSADEWPWSSFRHYLTGEVGVVEIESEWTVKRRESGGRIALPG